MHKLMEYVCDQLDELERKAEKEGKLSMSEIEYLDKLAHIKKSLLSADEMWDQSEYSEENRRGGGGNSYRGSYARRSYMDGGSYARGRGRNARRDAMGRYSGADEMVDELRDLMQSAPDTQTKQDIQRIVSRLEQM